jgi:Cu-processing system permease protein
MRAIVIIAKNTFTEIMRDRILYGLMIFGLFLIAVSLALGQLSFAEQTRITTNFGFTAMHLSAVILSIFVGSTLVAREIEKKTIMTLLVRSINRTQFIIGKAVGMMSIISVSILIIAFVLAAILYFMEIDLNGLYFIGMYGVLLEAGVLLAFTLFFGSFSSPIMAVSFSLGVFFIGHWIDSLRYFAERSNSSEFRILANLVNTTFPNLEHFNWRSLFVYSESVLPSHIFWNSVYAFAWMVLLVTLSALILRGRDLG